MCYCQQQQELSLDWYSEPSKIKRQRLKQGLTKRVLTSVTSDAAFVTSWTIALTIVVVVVLVADNVEAGVGPADMGLSWAGGVTEDTSNTPALASSVMACAPMSPSLELRITSLKHIVTKCGNDWVTHGQMKEIRNPYLLRRISQF